MLVLYVYKLSLYLWSNCWSTCPNPAVCILPARLMVPKSAILMFTVPNSATPPCWLNPFTRNSSNQTSTHFDCPSSCPFNGLFGSDCEGLCIPNIIVFTAPISGLPIMVIRFPFPLDGSGIVNGILVGKPALAFRCSFKATKAGMLTVIVLLSGHTSFWSLMLAV